MSNISKVERHQNLCTLLNNTYLIKNNDYGDSFHAMFLEEGMASARIRLSDKLNRFKNLTRNPANRMVDNESVRDTLLDMANYAIMTVMELDILSEEMHNEVGKK